MTEVTTDEYSKYLKFGEPIDCVLEISGDTHESILKVYGIENKRVYNINGEERIMTDSEFDKFWEELVEKGYTIKSIVMDFPDAPEEFTESQTMVGNKVKWGETP